jgi:hypothetical protein
MRQRKECFNRDFSFLEAFERLKIEQVKKIQELKTQNLKQYHSTKERILEEYEEIKEKLLCEKFKKELEAVNGIHQSQAHQLAEKHADHSQKEQFIFEADGTQVRMGIKTAAMNSKEFIHSLFPPKKLLDFSEFSSRITKTSMLTEALGKMELEQKARMDSLLNNNEIEQLTMESNRQALVLADEERHNLERISLLDAQKAAMWELQQKQEKDLKMDETIFEGERKFLAERDLLNSVLDTATDGQVQLKQESLT